MLNTDVIEKPLPSTKHNEPMYEPESDRLFALLPWLKPIANEKFSNYVDDWTSDFLVFEDVFNPYLVSLLDQSPSEVRDRQLQEIFSLLEEMTFDQEVEPGWHPQTERALRARGRNLVQVAVIENLEQRPDRWIPRARQFAGPQMAQLIDSAIADRKKFQNQLIAKPWLDDLERETLEWLNVWFMQLEQGENTAR